MFFEFQEKRKKKERMVEEGSRERMRERGKIIEN